jgi:hypothetical protein
MITEAKNKGKPRKKKAEKQEHPELSKELKETLRPFSTDATLDDLKEVAKCSCPACHATVTFADTYKCQHCGVYGCVECGFEPKPKTCPGCGVRR